MKRLQEIFGSYSKYIIRGDVSEDQDDEDKPVEIVPYDVRYRKFGESAEGQLFSSLKCRRTLTLAPFKAVKGKLPRRSDVVTCAWRTFANDNCPHVGGVDTSVGKVVTLYLRSGWEKKVVLNSESFWIGRPDAKQKAEQVDADQPATAVETKSDGVKKTEPASEGRSQ